jgi:DNA-binding response OmpR family regulator
MAEYLSHSLPVALVVEDDELVQEALKLALVEEAHLQVITAGVPELALPLVEAAAPEILLLDLGLPGASGWSVLAALRAHPAFLTLPVLIVTAQREAVAHVARLNDPWLDLVLKPFELATLLEQVTRLMQRHRALSADEGKGQALEGP